MITSHHNPTLQDVKRLLARKRTDGPARFVAEGEDLVAAARGVALAARAGERLTPADAGTLLVGAERTGLPEDVVAGCDRVRHIPIHSESLNAAMAATVALYEVAGPEGDR